MDYGKWRYQQQKKEDKSRASSKGGQLKELKLRTVRIGDHDLLIKVNHAKEFLKDGNKVQFTLQFKGREMAHLELGRDIMKKVKDELWQVSKVERDAKMEGRRMTLLLQPDHKSATAVKPVATPPTPLPRVPVGNRPNPVNPQMSSGAALNIPIRPAAAVAPAPQRQEPVPASR